MNFILDIISVLGLSPQEVRDVFLPFHLAEVDEVVPWYHVKEKLLFANISLL